MRVEALLHELIAAYENGKDLDAMRQLLRGYVARMGDQIGDIYAEKDAMARSMADIRKGAE